jgi:molybdopterin synthase catalytic subunit/molybdopterin synthase sulfur carrier subunit
MSGMKVAQAKPIHKPAAAGTPEAHGGPDHGTPVPTLKSSEIREQAQELPGARLDEIQVQLFAFGGTKVIVGEPEVQFSLAGPCSASEFLDHVCKRYPQLDVQRSALRLAVNGAYVGNEHRIGKGDEVALIPPVAGG